jgi:hypothetical protein
MNCTVPDGAAPLLCVLTVPVKVRLVPASTLDALVLTLAAVAACVTMRESVGEVLALKLLSPP